MHVFTNNGKRARSPSPIRSQPLIGLGSGTDPGAPSSSFFTQPLQFLPSNPSNPNPTNQIYLAQPLHLNAHITEPQIRAPAAQPNLAREPSHIPVINPIPDPIPEPIIDPVPSLTDPDPMPEPLIDPVPPPADPQPVPPAVPQPIPPPVLQLADPIPRQIPEEPLQVDNLDAPRDAIPAQDPPPPPPRAAQIRGSAQLTVSEEARHSLRLKAKEGAAKKKGDKSGANSGVIILSETDTSEEESNTWDSEEDPCLGLEGSDLSDYLRDRAECDALDAAFLSSANPPGQPSSSYTSSSVAS